MTDLPPPTQQLTDASVNTPDHPIHSVDASSLTVLFDMDPSPDTMPDADLDRLIAEYRRRADVNAAEAAAAALEAKKPKARRSRNTLVDAAMAAIADKPISELTLDDLTDDGEED